MREYISKEVAIELLSQPVTMSMCLSVPECHHKIAQRRIDLEAIKNIPAADVRPVAKGKWEAIDFHTVKCSKCGFDMDIMKVDTHVLNHANYCPNCGARMKRKTDGT